MTTFHLLTNSKGLLINYVHNGHQVLFHHVSRNHFWHGCVFLAKTDVPIQQCRPVTIRNLTCIVLIVHSKLYTLSILITYKIFLEKKMYSNLKVNIMISIYDLKTMLE